MQFHNILTQAQTLLNELDAHQKFLQDIERFEKEAHADLSIDVSSRRGLFFAKPPAPHRMICVIKEHTISEIKSIELKIQRLAGQLIDPALIDEHYAFISAEISRMQSLNASLLESIRQSQNP